MTSEVVARPIEPELTPFEVIERVITSGDLTKMSPADRVAFYWRTCESLGLNPLTRPFEYMSLNGRTILYARKDATEQLRRVNRVSVTELRRERDETLGIYTVYAHVRLPDGREDEATGIVSIKGLSGEALANALMKAETKAKRRATLSLVGLGFLDESEVEGLGERVDVDLETGEILGRGEAPTLLERVQHQAQTYADAPTVSIVHQQPESATETAADLVLEPMPEEVSATIAVEPEDDEDELEELTDEELAMIEQGTDTPSAPGLTLQELAELARAAKLTKTAFASALDVVPADVAGRIEAMDDQARWALAVQMGLVVA